MACPTGHHRVRPASRAWRPNTRPSGHPPPDNPTQGATRPHWGDTLDSLGTPKHPVVGSSSSSPTTPIPCPEALVPGLVPGQKHRGSSRGGPAGPTLVHGGRPTYMLDGDPARRSSWECSKSPLLPVAYCSLLPDHWPSPASAAQSQALHTAPAAPPLSTAAPAPATPAPAAAPAATAIS